MKKEKSAATASEWKIKTVDEFAVPSTTQVWKTQVSTAPDGKRLLGIRKFAQKANGDLQVTSMGLSVQHDAIAPKLLRKIARMLRELADNVEENEIQPQEAKPKAKKKKVEAVEAKTTTKIKKKIRPNVH